MNPGHLHAEIHDSSWDRQATIRREEGPRVMDDDLKPWGLYNLNGVDHPESLDHMKGGFTRYRKARKKAANNAYTDDICNDRGVPL